MIYILEKGRKVMEDMHIHLKKGVTDISIMREYIEKCKKCNIKRVLFLDHGNR